MCDLWLDVDSALAEVPVNIMPLLDDTDFKSREESVAYNAAGLELIWHFTTTAGATSATVVTPTTGGNYDWAHQDGGMYTIEIPASGGASINNDTEGFGWFTGVATGVLPWRGPVIGFRAAALNNALIDGGDTLDVNVTEISGDSTAADNCELMFDGAGYAGGTTKLGVDAVAISGDSTAADRLEAMLDGTLSGVVVDDNDPDPTATAFETNLSEATSDHVNGAFCLFTSGALLGQARKISDYDGTSKVLTVATAFTEAPAADDAFLIVGRSE